jgi:hypothetical protein
MDYMSRLYQNKSIQLQEQIDLLERKLKHLVEYAPASTFSGTGKGQQAFSDSQLEDQIKQNNRTGMFGSKIEDDKQNQEYKDAKAELDRRRGAQSTSTASSAPTSTQTSASTSVQTSAQRQSASKPTSRQSDPKPTATQVGVDITRQSSDQITAMNDPAKGGQSGKFGGDGQRVPQRASDKKPQAVPDPQSAPTSAPVPQSTKQPPDTLDLYNLRKKEDSGLQGELNKGFGLDWLGTPSAKPEPTPPAPDWFTGAQDFRNRFKNGGTSQPTGEAPLSRTEPTRVTPPITTTGVSPEEFEKQFRGPGETPKAKATNPKILPYQPILFDVRELGKLRS